MGKHSEIGLTVKVKLSTFQGGVNDAFIANKNLCQFLFCAFPFLFPPLMGSLKHLPLIPDDRLLSNSCSW